MEGTCITKVGQMAPEFKASGYDAKKKNFADYALSDFRGKYTLLFFYPGDFTYV